MNIKDIITIILVLAAIGVGWFLIKKLLFLALVAGGVYVGYKLVVASNKKQLKE